jgi:hypothetical protein
VKDFPGDAMVAILWKMFDKTASCVLATDLWQIANDFLTVSWIKALKEFYLNKLHR